MKRKSELGATATEYIIILVLVAVAAVAAWNKFGQDLKDKLDAAQEAVEGLETDRGE